MGATPQYVNGHGNYANSILNLNETTLGCIVQFKSNREQPLLAVLIDADNLSTDHAEAIWGEIKVIGEPALRRI